MPITNNKYTIQIYHIYILYIYRSVIVADVVEVTLKYKNYFVTQNCY